MYEKVHNNRTNRQLVFASTLGQEFRLSQRGDGSLSDRYPQAEGVSALTEGGHRAPPVSPPRKLWAPRKDTVPALQTILAHFPVGGRRNNYAFRPCRVYSSALGGSESSAARSFLIYLGPPAYARRLCG